MNRLESFMLVVASIATTAIAWGVYGPVLHWGQAGMGHGRLRPFMCVGIAYFAIAVVVPLVLLYGLRWEAEEKFGWQAQGTFWSFMGGVAGALGALGIIMAFNFGGAPNFVMPLVFGCAPVINTLFTMYFDYRQNPEHILNYFGTVRSAGYLAGLILVIAGAVTVLLFKPPPAPKPGHAKAGKGVESTTPVVEKRPKSLKPAAPAEAGSTSEAEKPNTTTDAEAAESPSGTSSGPT